jgi:hypothetical protein
VGGFSTGIGVMFVLLRASPAVMYNCYVSLFVESKMKKRAPAVLQNSSSTSNFFTKGTVALQK